MNKLKLFYSLVVFVATLLSPHLAEARTGFEGATCSAADRDPLKCMVCVINKEDNKTRGGMVQVAKTVMTRLHNPQYPKSICGVIYQPGQFFPRGKLPKDSGRLAMMVSAAREAMATRGNGFLGFRAYCRPGKGDKRIGGNCYRRDALSPQIPDVNPAASVADLSRKAVIEAANSVFGESAEARFQSAELILPVTTAK